jgi:hypothetical protein
MKSIDLINQLSGVYSHAASLAPRPAKQETRPMRSCSFLAALLLAACTALPLSATAQDNPPLRILGGFPPGGSADVSLD